MPYGAKTRQTALLRLLVTARLHDRQRSGNCLQSLARRIHSKDERDDSSDDHDSSADVVPNHERATHFAVTDQRTEDDRAKCSEDLGDREEIRDRLAPNFER